MIVLLGLISDYKFRRGHMVMPESCIEMSNYVVPCMSRNIFAKNRK